MTIQITSAQKTGGSSDHRRSKLMIKRMEDKRNSCLLAHGRVLL